MKASLPLAIAPLLGLALAGGNTVYCSTQSLNWYTYECPGWKAKGCCQQVSQGVFNDKFKNGMFWVDDRNEHTLCHSDGNSNSPTGIVACVD
ncbi:hypothetical protein PTNB73_07017 [Pyrenophora teres f. teres]|uniref:Uncharacterized protein n=1 Tax=Pyrenophora teres f. teres TaxID=97479 RepID=A0A6S6WBR8_9PLEO|nr:hypothetical protein HRS9139_10446 [Pyrenophora teres f. teres]KAE8822479.1 hypothetical protein PTNB85_10365 [Pyrenophora teres f. teres]KAE8858694.1 hypothetical protein PTNB29_07909 [Pyrenophora teres f. teres]KAE8861463.1 hypothetical protein PTNB73_07017 [Pyrenophora teres f. teres]CAE7204982.1 hypothetical protein PTTW11_09200 [Pyrenophora teres f. teres]